MGRIREKRVCPQSFLWNSEPKPRLTQGFWWCNTGPPRMSRSKIEVLFEDKWYEATVASRDRAFRANVRYADGSMEASVEESRIRARTPGTDGRARPKSAGSQVPAVCQEQSRGSSMESTTPSSTYWHPKLIQTIQQQRPDYNDALDAVQAGRTLVRDMRQALAQAEQQLTQAEQQLTQAEAQLQQTTSAQHEHCQLVRELQAMQCACWNRSLSAELNGLILGKASRYNVRMVAVSTHCCETQSTQRS